MKVQPLYLSLAVLLARHRNLLAAPTHKPEILQAVDEELGRLIREYLPSGSGFDSGTQLAFDIPDKGMRPRLEFWTAFHHMDEHGGYDGWTNHTVKVYPDFDGLRITVLGSNRNGILDYIGDVFYEALTAEVKAWPDIMEPGVRPIPEPTVPVVPAISTPTNLLVELFNRAVIGYHIVNPGDQVYLVRGEDRRSSLVLASDEDEARSMLSDCYGPTGATYLDHVGKLADQQPGPAIDNEKCPNCGSTDIQGEQFTVDGQQAHQPCSCNECYASWTDTFVMAFQTHHEMPEIAGEGDE